MERPFFEDDDYQDENLDEFFEEMQEAGGMPFIEMVPMELITAGMNQKVLSASMRICEHSFWWRFRSVKTKIRMIREVYRSLSQLLEG